MYILYINQKHTLQHQSTKSAHQQFFITFSIL